MGVSFFGAPLLVDTRQEEASTPRPEGPGGKERPSAVEKRVQGPIGKFRM
jgi:hypothetical protein